MQDEEEKVKAKKYPTKTLGTRSVIYLIDKVSPVYRKWSSNTK